MICFGKAGKYRDTVSVEPGSKPFCGSVSVSTENFWVSSVQKILFAYTNDTLDMSTETNTGLILVSKDTFVGMGNSLGIAYVF